MMQQRYLYIFELLREGILDADNVQWYEWRQMKQDVETMLTQGFMQEIHERMTGFYEDYLMGRMPRRSSAWNFIDYVAKRDDELGSWASERIDLMSLTAGHPRSAGTDGLCSRLAVPAFDNG